MTTLTKWEAEKDPRLLRRMNKTAEECGELIIVCTRVNNQGLDGINPKTGKTNRQELAEEMADVWAQIECNMASIYGANEWRDIQARREQKAAMMVQWEDMYPEQQE